MTSIANALGGYTLFTGRFNSTTGLVRTNDLLALPPGHVNEGLVGNGILVYVKVHVLDYGTTNLVMNNTVLIESCCPIVQITHTLVNGVFSNVPYNIPPEASFTMRPGPTDIIAGNTVHFDGSASFDRDGAIAKYKWEFGDGNITSATIPTMDHTYNTPGGPLLASLTVTDDGGATASASMTFFVNTFHPLPVAVFTFSPSNPTALENVTFDGTASSAPPADSIGQYFWDFGDGVKTAGNITRHVYLLPGNYDVSLIVKDTLFHQQASTSRTITVLPFQPTLKLSTFFTNSRFQPLPTDSSHNPKVDAVLENGTVRNTDPRQILVWVNITNTSGSPLQSLRLNETLPIHWIILHTRNSMLNSVHVYFANSDSLSKNLDITQTTTISLSGNSPERLHVSIVMFSLTRIGHSLMPGQTILVSVKLTYSLIGTKQTAETYPRIYNNISLVKGWTGSSFTGTQSSGTGFGSFAAYAVTRTHNDGSFDSEVSNSNTSQNMINDDSDMRTRMSDANRS